MKAHVSMFALLVGCGGGSTNTGVDGPEPPDAPTVFMDAPSTAPAMIKISGIAEEQAQSGSTPQADVAISIFKTSDETTPLATATTDAQGKYMVTVMTGGHDLDVYIKATKSGYVDTYAYPAAPPKADYTLGDANMLTSGTYGLLVSFAGGHSGMGVITTFIADSAGTAVEGATITTAPASGVYKYSDASGFPTSTTATAADGRAFVLDVPGMVTINAHKTGMTFHPHAGERAPDKFDDRGPLIHSSHDRIAIRAAADRRSFAPSSRIASWREKQGSKARPTRGSTSIHGPPSARRIAVGDEMLVITWFPLAAPATSTRCTLARQSGTR
jgi:hypothetical protein